MIVSTFLRELERYFIRYILEQQVMFVSLCLLATRKLLYILVWREANALLLIHTSRGRTAVKIGHTRVFFFMLRLLYDLCIV